MADLNVALILRLVDKASAPARAVLDRLDRASSGAFSRNSAQVNRGARMMAGGLGDVARGAGRAAAAVAVYNGVMAGTALALIRPAAQMERFKVQLKNLEGSSEGAERAMAWIQDFATRTPLELEDTISAYARLKAFGVDPTNGSLQALVDTMAATGGGAEQLDGLVLALGQAWTKGKLQGEEAMQMLERGVPVWDLLAQKLGRTTAEVQEMASAGQLGREELTLLVQAMAERNAGASDNMSKTWDGIISNLMDHWSRWQVMVMDAGLFDFLKSRLQILLDFLNAAAADGRLQRWAEQTAKVIMAALTGMWDLAVSLYEAWQQLYPWLEAAATALGGWQNLLIAIAALGFGRTIIGVAMGIFRLTRGVLAVTRGLIGMMGAMIRLAGPGVAALGRVGRAMMLAFGAGARAALTGVVRAASSALRIFMLLGRAVFMNPLSLAIAGVAAAVYVIYDNWDGIVTYFREKIGRVKDAFDEGFLKGIAQIAKEFNPARLFADAMVGLADYVNTKIRDAFGIDLIAEGRRMMDSLLEGIKSAAQKLLDWFASLPQRIRDAIGRIDIGSLIHWPEPPAWLRRLWNGEAGSGPAMPANTDAAPGSPRAVGGRALGGPVRAGSVYRWLEQGQEMFVPRTDGNVISNRDLKALRAGAGRGAGANISVGGITINAAPGMDPAAIARAVRREIERIGRDSRAVLHDGGAHA